MAHAQTVYTRLFSAYAKEPGDEATVVLAVQLSAISDGAVVNHAREHVNVPEYIVSSPDYTSSERRGCGLGTRLRNTWSILGHTRISGNATNATTEYTEYFRAYTDLGKRDHYWGEPERAPYWSNDVPRDL